MVFEPEEGFNPHIVDEAYRTTKKHFCASRSKRVFYNPHYLDNGEPKFRKITKYEVEYEWMRFCQLFDRKKEVTENENPVS
jgi:hypothetical protein